MNFQFCKLRVRENLGLLVRQEVAGKFNKTKIKIVSKIIVDTALRNVGAKRVLNASQFVRLFKQLMRTQRVINQYAKMEDNAIAKYGSEKNVPAGVKKKLDEFAKTIIRSHFIEVVEICGNKKFAIELLEEMRNLSSIASEADWGLR